MKHSLPKTNRAHVVAHARPFAVAALVAALAACNGEGIGLGGRARSSMGPSSCGEPVATHSALEADTAADGTYTSADGSVTGTYDRSTLAFDLVKREAADEAP